MGVESVGDRDLRVKVIHNNRLGLARLEGHLGRRRLAALILCAHYAKVANRNLGAAEVRVVGYEVDVAALHVHPEFFTPSPHVSIYSIIRPGRVVWVVRVGWIIKPRSPFKLLVEVIVGIVTYVNLESLEPVLGVSVAIKY